MLTKELKQAGDNTATWVFVGTTIPDFNNFFLYPADFDALPEGRLKDVLTATYSGATDEDTYASFMSAFAALGGKLTATLGAEAADPTFYSIGFNAVFNTFEGRVRLAFGAVPFPVPVPTTGYLVVKLALNYSAGR